jgi:hypothetical protein
MNIRAFAHAGVLLGALACSDAARSGQFTVNHMGMKPDEGNYTTTYTARWDDGLRNVRNGSACFSTGVNLPDRTVITGIFVTYDSKTGTLPYVALIRHALTSDDYRVVSDATLADKSGKRKTAKISLREEYATVDNSRYAYGFGICLAESGGDTFYALRITHTDPQP